MRRTGWISSCRLLVMPLALLFSQCVNGQSPDEQQWQISFIGIYSFPYGERCIEMRAVNPMNSDPTVQGLCRIGSIGIGWSVRKDFSLNKHISILSGIDYVVRPTNLNREVSLGLGDDEVNYSRSKNMRIEVPVYAMLVKRNFSLGLGAKWLVWHQRKIYRHTNNRGKYLFFKNNGRTITNDYVASVRAAYSFKLKELPFSASMEIDFRDPAFRQGISSWVDLLNGISYHF